MATHLGQKHRRKNAIGKFSTYKVGLHILYTKISEKCFVGRMPCREQGHYNAAALDVQTRNWEGVGCRITYT